MSSRRLFAASSSICVQKSTRLRDEIAVRRACNQASDEPSGAHVQTRDLLLIFKECRIFDGSLDETVAIEQPPRNSTEQRHEFGHRLGVVDWHFVHLDEPKADNEHKLAAFEQEAIPHAKHRLQPAKRTPHHHDEYNVWRATIAIVDAAAE